MNAPCLVDALDACRILRTRPPNEWSQIQSADALLLSKPDLAGGSEQQAFDEIAAAQYPAKRFLGRCRDGELPPEAVQNFERPAGFTLLREPDAISPPNSIEFAIGGLAGGETQLQQLGLWAVNWVLPSELTFARAVIEPRLTWLLETYDGWLRRLKAAMRLSRHSLDSATPRISASIPSSPRSATTWYGDESRPPDQIGLDS